MERTSRGELSSFSQTVQRTAYGRNAPWVPSGGEQRSTIHRWWCAELCLIMQFGRCTVLNTKALCCPVRVALVCVAPRDFRGCKHCGHGQGAKPQRCDLSAEDALRSLAFVTNLSVPTRRTVATRPRGRESLRCHTGTRVCARTRCDAAAAAHVGVEQLWRG